MEGFNCDGKVLKNTKSSFPPYSEQAVFAPRHNPLPIWTPVHCVHLVAVPGQVRMQLLCLHRPQLEGRVCRARYQESAVGSPRNLIHSLNVASQCHKKPACLTTPYPDALVKAGTGNKPGIRAELDVIYKLLMACHSGYRGLFAAWFPEEKCEVIAARQQHLLAYHLHNSIVASLCICFGLFCRQKRVVGDHFGVLRIKSSGPHHIVGVQSQHIHPMSMALQRAPSEARHTLIVRSCEAE